LVASFPLIAWKMMAKPSAMLDAYSYLGKSEEFTAPRGINQRSFDQRATNVFLSAPSTRCYSEFPLSMFCRWYQDLPLVHRLMELHGSQGCEDPWQFKVVLLYPKIVPTNAVEKKKFEWGTSMATNFYLEEFRVGDEALDVAGCIQMTVLFDATIMVVGRPCAESEVSAVSQSIFDKKQGAVVVSAITFRNGTDGECGSSLVIWLLVRGQQGQRMPSALSSWRRLGFGRLLLIMVIKRSTIELLFHNNMAECNDALQGVDIYLQALSSNAWAFFQSCGFVRINHLFSTGLELLPKSIGDTVVGEGEFVWIAPTDPDAITTIALFRLRSGCLLNTPVEPPAEETVAAQHGPNVSSKR
jgi:hypothetical protein